MRVRELGEVLRSLKPYLKDYLEEHGIDASRHFKCIFPDHDDNNPSCHLLPDGEAGWCSGCTRSFDIMDACSILEDKPREGKGWITDTVAHLAKKYKVDIRVDDVTEDDIYEINTYRAYAAASKLLTHNPPEGSAGRKEMERRGWTPETLQKFGIGVVLDYDQFVDKLKSSGKFTATFLREIDLSRKDLFNPDHLIFTWKDEHGRPVGFTGRFLRFEEEKAAGNQTKAKYLNTRTTTTDTGRKCLIFKKNSRLFGLDTALKTTPPLWIFEGQADVITCKQEGLLNCACFAGGDLSSDQVYLIKKLGIYEVTICLDGDSAGKLKLEKIVKSILPGHRDLSVKIALLPEGEDPDSFVRKNGLDELTKEIPQLDIFEWRLGQISEDEDPTEVSRKVVGLIALEPSPIKRDKYCRLLAAKTDISLKAIQDELNIKLDEKSYQVARERGNIIDKITHELRSDPFKAEEILRTGYTDIVNVNIKHNCSAFSASGFTQVVRDQKVSDENKGDKFEGFFLGPDLVPLEKALEGDWTKDIMICIGGRENCGKCLAEGTKVLLADGSYKKIEDVVKDKDKLIVKMNPDFKLAQGEVLNWMYSGELECFEIQTEQGISIMASANHPFFTINSWKKVSDLSIKDSIAYASNTSDIERGEICFSRITSIIPVGYKHCYDLEVKDDHNFVANNYIVHNSAIIAKIGMAIAENNDDVVVILHTIDDSISKLIPRLVCIADGRKELQQNQITGPYFWEGKEGVVPDLIHRREVAYQKILNMINDEKIVGKDINDGYSQAFIEGLLAYYAEKGKRVIYSLDNFHKLDWFPYMTDQRSKWRKTSDEMKKLAEKYHISMIHTVEYHKMSHGTKPTNYNIGESQQLAYDANFLLHLYSELTDLPDKFTICHEDNNGYLPRLECIIGKNKIGASKDTFFLDFWPACSEYRWVSSEQVRIDAEAMKVKLGRSKISGDEDPFIRRDGSRL